MEEYLKMPAISVSFVQLVVQIISGAAALFAVGTVVVTRTLPWLYAKLQSSIVHRGLGSAFSKAQIQRAVRYYIAPMCQDLDPAGAEEPRLVFGMKQKLFDALAQAISDPTEFRYIMLLADSGMGKTCALINLYARHSRKWLRPFNMVLIPLGVPDADDRIAAVEEKGRTVLLLDAFDEDTQAVVDHVERLRLILLKTQSFYRVVITCRTQFFSSDEEIPRRTGVMKVAARAAGEPAEYYFHKVYLCPFSDLQIKRYINRKYPVWRMKMRRAAIETVKMIPNLSVRPMLLAHVDDIIKARRPVRYSFELYEEMIEAWLVREEGFIPNKENLRQFSELLAVDLYINRTSRGAERVRGPELESLAKDWNIPIESWILTGRSLLNRDSEGYYKFAHRSIMEYLIVVRAAKGDTRALALPWTDQMNSFVRDVVDKQCFISEISRLFCGLARTILSYRDISYRDMERSVTFKWEKALGGILFSTGSFELRARRFLVLLGGILPAAATISIQRSDLRRYAMVRVTNEEIIVDASDFSELRDWFADFVSSRLREVDSLDQDDTFFSIEAGGARLWDPLESTCRHASLSIL